ncbi:phosphatase PAP2 family protein [Streptomyces sp. NPDC006265]|uniref:phosphatase PAP2 family protein n=1 Tax=Streptomyces sp. NPDC006265 TaxID=3156740 RepID=UPI0033B187BC
MTGARAGTASRHLVGSAVSAVALVMLTAQVASESDAISAFDAGTWALADRALGTSGGPWLGIGGWADLAGSTLLGVGLLAVLGVLLGRRRFGAALWVLAGLTVQFAAEMLLEPLVGRLAPVPADGTPPDAEFSFPSGHMASATLVLVVLLVVMRTGTPLWWLCLGMGPLLVAAVGISRVLADAHHAADVAGGCLLGLVVGFAVAWRLDVCLPPNISGKEA